MSRVCFVSYEIHPTTRGGCGVLLHNAAQVLLAEGHEVLFLLDVPEKVFDRFENVDRLSFPRPERCRAYHVDALCQRIPLRPDDFCTTDAWRAYRFHFACQQVYAAERPDVIEFFDFCGVAHYALSAKATGRDYEHSHLAVRAHNTFEMLDVHEATNPLSFQRYMLYALEHNSLRLAESVLYPSDSYLRDGYQPHYEPWLGRSVRSQPPLVVWPESAPPRPDADIALFYGRLFAWKGVDLFVDAAVAYLENRSNPPLQFYLVGYDSHCPPIDVLDYRTYLLRKIPKKYRDRFVFTGWLDWNRFAELLPRVRFGVFPSYFESFCYALHEVYLARIPVIVSDTPGIRDFFRHEDNALLFDGSVSDLTRQMERLAGDAGLHERITLPYPVATAPLGDFYRGPFHESWVNRQTPARQPSLLVCMIDDGQSAAAARTLDSLAKSRIADMRVVRLRPDDDRAEGVAAWLLGALRTLHDDRDGPLLPANVSTKEALVILRAGDQLHPDYLRRSLETLARQPEIGFVGSWRHIHDAGETRVDTFPLDAALELVPFLRNSPLSRCVLRTAPDTLLIDLFPPNAGAWGELAYLWDQDTGRRCGVVIPEVLVAHQAEPAKGIDPATLAYLVVRDNSTWRKARLSRYLLEVWSQAKQRQPTPTGPPDSGLVHRVHAMSHQSLQVARRFVHKCRDRAIQRLRK
jgi:glycosyltransferase involved in cell wall biosynthesis